MRIDNKLCKPIEISIEKLYPFEGHPYKVLDNEEMEVLTESVHAEGVISPLIVRPLNDADGYEVISGHRRLHAAQRAGLSKVPGGHMVGECGKSRNGTFYYYYKCINAKHGHTCKRKALKRDWLERAVVVETVTKVLTDEVIDRVADAIIAIQGQENPMIPSIKEQLRVCDKGLKNLLKAIEAGIFTPTTKERMEELERQKEELNISLIRAQMAQPVFTKEEIVKWISRFKYGNINDKAYQREMIDTFLNSVYVYDDKIVFTYNFRDHAETVTLD